MKIVSLDSKNSKLLRNIEDIVGEETPTLCYQCNMCTSGCPVADLMDPRPHQIMQLTRMGMEKQLLESDAIWRCTLCLKCKERCPQTISAVDVILALRNIAIRRGKIPTAYPAMLDQLEKTGIIYNVIDLQMEDREDLELPSIPKPKNRKFANLLKTVGLKKLLNQKQTEGEQ